MELEMFTLQAAPSAALAGERSRGLVLHSHYYHAALHRAITETGKIDGRLLLERAAAVAAARQWKTSPDDVCREERVHRVVGAMALGEASFVTREGDALRFALAGSPLAAARVAMFGPAAAPACDLVRGMVSGSLSAAEGRDFAVEEEHCEAAGASQCLFAVRPLSASLDVPELAGPPEHHPDHRSSAGSASERLLPSGWEVESVLENYACSSPEVLVRAAEDFETELPRVMGSKFANLASIVLTEASHLGAFYGFAELLRSQEGRALLGTGGAATGEAVESLLAVVAELGWGDWRLEVLVPQQRLTVRVHNGYDALWRRALTGPAEAPRCYFARGVVAALMNLLSVGDVRGATAVDPSLYNELFRSPLSFRAIETRCQAMGDPYCEFVANPLSPSARLR
jgi:predicted hydrocarbon binding protein